MLSFRDACTLWRSLPFPRGARSEGLAFTHSELAGADEHVTPVIRFVERGVFKPAPVDVLTELERIMRAIEVIRPEVTGEELAVADTQHAYAALLHLVYSGFFAHAPSPS